MAIDMEFERARIVARTTRDYLRQVQINEEIKALQLQIELLESEALTLDPFLSSCVTGDAIDASIKHMGTKPADEAEQAF